MSVRTENRIRAKELTVIAWKSLGQRLTTGAEADLASQYNRETVELTCNRVSGFSELFTAELGLAGPLGPAGSPMAAVEL